MHPFRKFILRYTPLPESDWAQIEACLERTVVPAEVLILREGKICRHLFFLESGLLRFFVLQDGREVTKFFTDAPYCFTSQRSFTGQLPARESIGAIEDSIVWRLGYDDAFALLKLDAWNTFVRKLIQEVQGYTEDILEALQNQTA